MNPLGQIPSCSRLRPNVQNPVLPKIAHRHELIRRRHSRQFTLRNHTVPTAFKKHTRTSRNARGEEVMYLASVVEIKNCGGCKLRVRGSRNNLWPNWCARQILRRIYGQFRSSCNRSLRQIPWDVRNTGRLGLVLRGTILADSAKRSPCQLEVRTSITKAHSRLRGCVHRCEIDAEATSGGCRTLRHGRTCR